MFLHEDIPRFTFTKFRPFGILVISNQRPPHLRSALIFHDLYAVHLNARTVTAADAIIKESSFSISVDSSASTLRMNGLRLYLSIGTLL